MTDRQIDVFCYAGHKGEESPRSFLLKGERIEVVSVVTEWLEEGREDRKRKRFFKIKGSDGFIYTLCYDDGISVWFLTDR